MVLVRAPRAPRDLTESGLELVASLGTTIGIRAKFESPESHRSDFGGEWKPISNSDQIRSAQKWHLSIPPDSSRRDKAPAPNRVKIGRRTSPHAPPEVRRFRSTRTHAPHARQMKKMMAAIPTRPHKKALSEFSRHSGFIREVGFQRFCFHFGEARRRSDLRALIMLSDADYAPGKPRMKDTEGDEQEDDWADQTMHWTRGHDEMSAHGLWTKLKEMYREKTSQNKVLLRRLVLKLQRGTTVAEQTSEFQRATGRGQKKRPEKRSQEGGHRGQEKRRDKKNCPRNKAQDQSSEAATTAMMAVDESDVLLAASADEESDWILIQELLTTCAETEVFSTHVACEGIVRMANDAIVGKGQSASGGTLRVSKGNRRSCKRKKTGRLYRLRENVQTGELLSDIGPVWNRSARRCFGIRAEVWPDTRKCNCCRMSMKKLRGERDRVDAQRQARRRRNESLSLEISGDPRETENTKPLEEVVPISIHPNFPDRQVMIGTELTDDLRIALIDFLKKNYDVFAWSQGDIPGIDPEVAMHKLFTKPEYSPVRQKRRKFAPERLKVIEDEVNKLIKANVVREAHYPDWLANVVVAPKKGESGGSKCTLLTLRKLLFITERGQYCYKVMPFGLKNAGATYQRLVNKMFNAQIGKTMKVYIDDMLVKSLHAQNHIAHLEEAFDILRRHIMMLNPSKCIFGVSSGKFLGFLVTKRGIEVNPDQIQALIAMKSPRNIREVQQLTGRVAALNRFVSKSADKYPRIEKIAYALMIAARKLRHYFQAHSIIVLTDQPLKQILQRPDTSGRLLKWSIELSQFHIEYKPRTAIKAQALADFIVESTYEDTPQPETTPLEEEIPNEPAQDLAHWILFVDGSSNQHGCATNNEAEYKALLAGLRVATELGAQSLEVFSDSQLVVNQVQGDYLAKDARMIAYLGEVHTLEFLTSPSIGIANQVLQTEENPTWLDEIIAYLQEGILPRDKLQARRLQYRSARFCIFKGRLYKRSFLGPLLRCLQPEEAKYVLREIHEGICGNHSGARSLAKKTIRQGYFWPTIERDAAAYIKKCDKCQRFAPVGRLPHTEMVPMSSPWPFAQWGIDILGPLPQAPLQRKFLIVAIDYFTKWIEAQPLAKITEKNTWDFVWKHLVCRFGVPKVIISDNARQFDNDRNLKARLERSKSEWAENLPSILWAYHTTSRIPKGETPYSMVFGTESVIPVEIGMPSFRVSTFNKETNEAELRLNLDLLEERRESAQLRQTAYKCQVAKYYNQRVRHRSFLPGDLVLRKVTLSTKEPNAGKLGPTWEGPYKVIKVSRPGTYWLEDLDGKALSHPWNAEHLKKYYQ
ncbi:hypothetical protein Acr_00g0060030 [Actinidia rufa]|uniref:Integrase catalytic domain-containing protein n=1 Tax=Actinidia rufa TaxID=165716 RepID=A0A7J0DQA8_9ERIC|nr:hypothetical protein Acr_00g0060030 [Actinidia rufa]